MTPNPTLMSKIDDFCQVHGMAIPSMALAMSAPNYSATCTNPSRKDEGQIDSMSASPEALAISPPLSSDPEQMQEAGTPLLDKWVLYAHLPNDTEWDLKSYRRVLGFNALEQCIALAKVLPEIVVKRCMLFMMRSHIEPRWEDPLNKNGGSFSFKVSNKTLIQGWRNLMYSAVGEGIFSRPMLNSKVTGITISPKRSFSIVKVWLTDCSNQDPNTMNEIPGLQKEGCIFKRHNAK